MTSDAQQAAAQGSLAAGAIAYATDIAFLPFVRCSILSLHETVRRACDFYILLDADEQIDVAPLFDELSQLLRRIAIIRTDLSQTRGWKHSPYVTSTSYGRLFLHEHVPAGYERVLYLDGDTLAGPVPVDLYEDLSGYPIGAVEDFGLIATGQIGRLRTEAGLTYEGAYFNAGVLLIDWRKWLDGRYGEKALDFIRSGRDTRDADQAPLNHVLDGNWKKLAPSWNVHPAQLKDRALLRQARVLHFTGSKKPWFADRWKHDERYCDHYLECASHSPIPIPVSQKTAFSILNRKLRAMVPLWVSPKYRRYRRHLAGPVE